MSMCGETDADSPDALASLQLVLASIKFSPPNKYTSIARYYYFENSLLVIC